MKRIGLNTSVAALWVLVLLLAGCPAEQGKYTAQAAKDSEHSNRGMKAAAAYDNARQRFLAGDFKQALELVGNSLAMNHDVAETHVLRVRILLEMGQEIETLRAVQEAKKVAPHDSRICYYEGLLHERMGRPDKAMQCYTEAAWLAPESVQYRLAIAEMMIEQGQLEQAAAYLDEQTKEHPNSPALLQTRAYVAMLQKQPAEAVRYLTQACTLAPNQASLAEDLAKAHFDNGKYNEAMVYLRPLLGAKESQDRLDLQYMAVRCLMELDQPVEAREILRKIIASDSGKHDFRAWEDMAAVSIKLGDQPQLRDTAARMMALDPKRVSGYLAMAMYEKLNGHMDAAAAALYHCRKVAGPSPIVDQCLADLAVQPEDGSRKAPAQIKE